MAVWGEHTRTFLDFVALQSPLSQLSRAREGNAFHVGHISLQYVIDCDDEHNRLSEGTKRAPEGVHPKQLGIAAKAKTRRAGGI
jgi:hypothetical protein